ncbi:MAG TPA: MFS transporter [Candidatus Dormibacteraeota bacterium]|nr:MFS transporter [Candidatus Dormibacteraeota bacterium]
MTAVAVGAPAERRLRQLDFIVLASYWVAIGYLWTSLGTLILPDIVLHLVGPNVKGTAISALEGIGTVMAIVWQPMMGAVSDRTRSRFGRRRPFIFGGTVGDVLFLAGLALSGSYGMLVIFYFLLQTASNTAQGPYQGLQPDVVPEGQRGTASGYYGLANLIGTLTGTVVAGLILNKAGRPAAFGSIAVLLVVTMLVTVLFVPDRVKPAHESFHSARDVVTATFTTPLSNVNFMWLMGSRLLILMGIVGLQTYTFFFFTDAFFHGDSHATTTATTAVVGLVVALAILVTWPAARLSDRIGRKPLIVIGGLIATAGMLVLVFAGYRWLPSALLSPVAQALGLPELAAQTLAAGVLVGAGLGAFLSVDWAFITDVIPRDEAGLFFGFSNIATAGAGVIARFLAGPLLDRFNAGPHILGLPGGYPVVFGVFVAWLLLGTLLILKVRETR